MSSIRVRPPTDDGRWTFEWYSVGGDGLWVVLRGGRIHHTHTWRLAAWFCMWRKRRGDEPHA